MTRRYASGTSVSPEQTQAEITRVLLNYGAKDYMAGFRGNHAVIEFIMKTRHIRIAVLMPELKEFRDKRNPARAWEQAVRERWRQLLLILKARLEAVQSGIHSFEKEFFTDFVMPGGMTLYELASPKLDDLLAGRLHLALPGPKAESEEAT